MELYRRRSRESDWSPRRSFPLRSECVSQLLQILLAGASGFYRGQRRFRARIQFHHDDLHILGLLQQKPANRGEIHLPLSQRAVLRPMRAPVPILQVYMSKSAAGNLSPLSPGRRRLWRVAPRPARTLRLWCLPRPNTAYTSSRVSMHVPVCWCSAAMIPTSDTALLISLRPATTSALLVLKS